MPKKFKEVNSKAVEARERKAAVKKEVDERKKKEQEDEYWRDDDKHVKRKQDRKDERDKKRQEQLERKSELKKLANDEMASLKSKTTGGAASKVTRAQISEIKAKEKQPSGATPLPKKVTEDPPLLENPNLLMRERESQGIVDASTVDEAISVLSVKDPAVDKHPERRMKAAFAAFEERELPRLKEENPQLRLSQLKQLLKKEWMKSPENPMNQLHQPYNKS